MPNIFQPQPLSAADLAPLTRTPPEINYDPRQTDQAFASAKAIGDSMGQAFTPLLPQNRLAEELKNQTNMLHQNSMKRLPAGTDLIGAQTVQNYVTMAGAPLYKSDGMYDVEGMGEKLTEFAAQQRELQNAVLRAKANPWKSDARTELAMTKALESAGIALPPTATSMDKWNAMQGNPAAVDVYHQLLQSTGAKTSTGAGGSLSTSGGAALPARAVPAMIGKEAPMVNMATAANETSNLETASQVFKKIGDSALKSHPNLSAAANLVPGIRPADHKIQLGFLMTKLNYVPDGPQKAVALKALGVWETAKNVLRVDMPNMMNPGKSATDEDMKAYDRDYFNLGLSLKELGKTTDVSFKQQLDSTMDLISTRTGAYSLLIPKSEQQALDLGGYYFGAGNKIGRAQLVRYGKEIPIPAEVISEGGQTDLDALQSWLGKNRGASIEIVPLSPQQLQEYNAASRQPGFISAQQVPAATMTTTRNAEEILAEIRKFRENPDSQGTSFNRITKGLKLLQNPETVSALGGGAQPAAPSTAPQVGETWNWKDATGVETPYTMQPDGSWKPAAAASAPAPASVQSKVGQLLGVKPTPAAVAPLPVPTALGKPLATPAASTQTSEVRTNAQKLNDSILGISGAGETPTWDKW